MMELHPASNTVGGSESAVRRSIAINIGLSGGWLSLLSRVHRHQQHYDDRFPWEGVSNKVTVAWAACGCQTNRTCDSTLTGTLQRSSQHCNRNANYAHDFMQIVLPPLLMHLNKRLSKQWWGWWFETLSCPLWRHCNVGGKIRDFSGVCRLVIIVGATILVPFHSCQFTAMHLNIKYQ